jgi:hypothetical protein
VSIALIPWDGVCRQHYDLWHDMMDIMVGVAGSVAYPCSGEDL